MFLFRDMYFTLAPVRHKICVLLFVSGEICLFFRSKCANTFREKKITQCSRLHYMNIISSLHIAIYLKSLHQMCDHCMLHLLLLYYV
jgi:hypothetical protein